MYQAAFSRKLLRWSKTFDRKMPWKDRSDAYAIWLSEIILQQTRVEQGLPYYLRFLDRFPTVQDLAKAEEQEVMRLWQGLGYYSRARNLYFTAQYISEELGGIFPDSYQGLLALKGVGPYTAAAIASFAFDLPHAVVDGNVFRVLARYSANFIDIGTPAGKKTFTLLANQLLDVKYPGRFNQALMDLGALVCKPTNPSCSSCPLSGDCQALELNIINSLPVKAKKIKRKTRYFYYFVFRKDKTFWIQKREGKDIWKSLFEFPHVESEKELSTPKLKKAFQQSFPEIAFSQKKIFGPQKQLLTHQKIYGVFFEIKISRKHSLDLVAIQESEIKDYPFPKMMTQYFEYLAASK